MTKKELTPEQQAEIDETFGTCEPCKVAVFGGSLVFVCQNEASDANLCEELNHRFSNGELTVRELYDKVRPLVPENIQEQLDNMMAQGEDLGLPFDTKLPEGGVTPEELDEA